MGTFASRLIVITFVMLCGVTRAEEISRNYTHYRRDKETILNSGSGSNWLVAHTENSPAVQHASSESVATRTAFNSPVSSSNSALNFPIQTQQISIQHVSVTRTLASNVNDGSSTYVSHETSSSSTSLALQSIHSYSLTNGVGIPQITESGSQSPHYATPVPNFIPAQATNSHNRGFLNQHSHFRGSSAHPKVIAQANSTVVESVPDSKSTAPGFTSFFIGNNNNHHHSQSLTRSQSSTLSNNEVSQSTQEGPNPVQTVQPFLPIPPIVPILGSVITPILGDHTAGKTDGVVPSTTYQEDPQPTEQDSKPTVTKQPLLPIPPIPSIVGSVVSPIFGGHAGSQTGGFTPSSNKEGPHSIKTVHPLIPLNPVHSILSSVTSDILGGFGHGHGHGHGHTTVTSVFESTPTATRNPPILPPILPPAISEPSQTTTTPIHCLSFSFLGPGPVIPSVDPSIALSGSCAHQHTTGTVGISVITSPVISATRTSKDRTRTPMQIATGFSTSGSSIATLPSSTHRWTSVITFSTHSVSHHLPQPPIITPVQATDSSTSLLQSTLATTPTPTDPEETTSPSQKHTPNKSTTPTKTPHHSQTGTAESPPDRNEFIFGDQLVHPQSVGGIVIGIGAVIYILAMAVIYIFMRRRYEQENGIQTPLTPAPKRRWNQRPRRYGRL